MGPDSDPPDGGEAHSATFRPGREEQMQAWLDERQGKLNLYLSVNPTLHPIAGRNKAKKTDLAVLYALHVDIDPRAGEGVKIAQNGAVYS